MMVIFGTKDWIPTLHLDTEYKCVMRMSIPSELFNARGNEFYEKKLSGCFIVKIQNTFSTVTRQIDSEVTDIDISDSGELEYSNSRIIYNDEPTLFLYGELIDFYLDQEQ